MKLIIEIVLIIKLLQVVTGDFRNCTYSHIISDIQNVQPHRVMSRSEWLANPSTGDLPEFEKPVENVIIAHTATESCSTEASCTFQTRFIQTFHVESRHFDDIAYNFLIGGDGTIYEGRGWDKIGAHTKGFNKDSLGIAFIGTFSHSEPPQQQLNAAKFLIDKAPKLGKLAANYKLYAQRQLIITESPGQALFKEIQNWCHFEYLNSILKDKNNNKYSLNFITRNKWLAREPTANLDNLQIPVKKVIIAHTASPECQTQIECSPKVRNMQRYHIDEKGYNDISYNFLIGGDGSVYEGRGWNKIDAHTKDYNEDNGIYIAFIGDFMLMKPTDEQLNSAKLLINDWVEFGDLKSDYILYGQRQLVATASPGDELFNEISKWPNFVKLKIG